MDVMEAMKNEGNALFQQQRFDEAVRVYTSVLDKLRDSGPVDETAARLEIAVRLNRAWARVQIPNDESSEATLAAAEQDCSSVIAKDASCVKAFYRRALARERRGQWKVGWNSTHLTTSSSSNALAGEAEDAWKSLQAAEIDLLNVYSKKRPSMARRKQKEPQKDKREISQKTDDLWESLRCEEITTVAKAFPRSKKGASIE
ncbi:acetolactate synthase small subunit [Phytophthora nicotianae]|uniref:Acetolactate synthase small subunit n=1 Tax=Phytophthora nicotianae TaxID=4792 RepID=A0A0W8D7S0_PHYNI|nr:acetolactate synthase small subunit [Phytophthora nicotianae]